MSLSPEQRREYRGIAHNLKPVIIVGDKGLTEGLQEELERALNDHELIKVKVASQDREVRQEAINALCEASGAELIQTIGKIAVIMRRAKQPNPKLSNLLREKSGRA
jgi:RNA-binding protein